MAVKITYRANNSEFGQLMMSDQTQDLADHGAATGAAYARLYAKGAGLPADYVASIEGRPGPPVTLGGNPRRTARTVAEHRLAATFEFGSGKGSKSGPSGRKRPQGGYSDPYRILGRAGARTGSPPKRVR